MIVRGREGESEGDFNEDVFAIFEDDTSSASLRV
ncbi:hypothetical protein A2U01_0088265 [Trifolium medium]|uniref:Uncharacterized protein n=1 Tax=Trifolium medium TaxID=97028 RepID=A0A392U2L1_9FABA|nr:hypothetical protein [Trifolium medium]